MTERPIRFSGEDWIAREGAGGPGNGAWSNDLRSIWVDGVGHLHMRVRHDRETWWQTGVQAVVPAKHGSHVFRVIANLERLSAQVMFGLFLYFDDDHELDIEFRGGALSYTVQPYDTPGHCHAIDLRLSGDHTTHVINWQPAYVDFGSFHGHAERSQRTEISSFRFAPVSDRDLRVMMNLWIYEGTPTEETEVTIAQYDRE